MILFSLVPLIDVHVGWISSATHDPDKPREPPVVVLEVAVIEVVNAAAQRIGAGELGSEIGSDPFMFTG